MVEVEIHKALSNDLSVVQGVPDDSWTMVTMPELSLRDDMIQAVKETLKEAMRRVGAEKLSDLELLDWGGRRVFRSHDTTGHLMAGYGVAVRKKKEDTRG